MHFLRCFSLLSCNLTLLPSVPYYRLNPGQDSIDLEKSPRLWGEATSPEAVQIPISNVDAKLSETDQ
jgi:hypothetical protein